LGNLYLAIFAPGTHFDAGRTAAEERVYGFCHVRVHGEMSAVVNFDQDIERRRRFPFEDGLLGPTPSGFFVTKSDRLDAADQIGQDRVLDEIFQRAAVGRGDQTYAAFGDGAGR
jgi:hypothetical protein